MGSKHDKPKGHEKYGKKCSFLHDLTLLKLQKIPNLQKLSETDIYDIYCSTYENFKTAVKTKEAAVCEHAVETVDE